MFSFDEAVKSWFFLQARVSQEEETSTSTFAYLLNHHWNQLVVNLLVAPAQWLHVSHMLRSTDWMSYSNSGKLLVLLYVAICFAAWEEVRIFAYVVARRLQAGDSLLELAAKLLSAGREVRKETAPLVDQVTNVASNLGVQVGGQAARMLAAGAGAGAGGGGSPRSPPRSPSGGSEVAENLTRRSL